VATDDRYCTNCRAVIPPGTNVCPACGVYAGDVFDGRMPKSGGGRVAGGGWRVGFLMVILVAAGVAAFWWFVIRPAAPRFDTGPIRVVGDRPGGARRPAGAAINEPEAILTLRHYFATQTEPVKSECIAVMSRGYSNGYYSFDAVNSCSRARLGRWRVNAKSRAVSR